MAYAHETVLSESGISRKDLPSEILNKIKAFDLNKGRKSDSDNLLSGIAIAQMIVSWMDENNIEPKDGDSATEPTLEPVVEPVAVIEPAVVIAVEEPVKKNSALHKDGKRFVPLIGWVKDK